MNDHEKTYLDLDFSQRLKTESISRQYGKTLNEIMNKFAEIVIKGTFRYSTPAGYIDFVVDPISYSDEKKKRIYISGPISGHDIEQRRRAFWDAQILLERKGFEPVNPMENGLPDDASIHDHMKRDIEMLMTCDMIYMMRRWTHSKGCKVEFDVATAIGLPVLFEESGEIIEFV